MDRLIIWAFLSRFPDELTGYIAFGAALQPIVQCNDVICTSSASVSDLAIRRPCTYQLALCCLAETLLILVVR